MNRIVRLFAGLGLIALGLGLLPLVAAAHEHRDVGNGQYTLVVGFLDEPAFVGLKNGLDLRVTKPDPAATVAAGSDEEEQPTLPVEGLADTLEAEVIFGDQKMTLEIEPRFGQPGAYRAVFFPMAEGDYTFHIFGQIEGVAIDETFTSSPETFSGVNPVEPYQFPKPTTASTETSTVASVAGAPLFSIFATLAGLAGASWLRRRRDRASDLL